MRSLALAAVLLASTCLPAVAAEPVSDGCLTEISMLCHRLVGAPLVRCLEKNDESLTPRCREALNEWAEEQKRAAAPAAPPAAETTIRLVMAAGTVLLRPSGKPADQLVAAQPGMALEPGDLVRTGLDGSAEVALDGQAIVVLSPGSDFGVQSAKPEETRFFLGLGRAMIKADKGLARRLVIATPAAAVTPSRGTELGLEQLEKGEARAAVFDEGTASVAKADGTGAVALAANRETSVAGGASPAPARPLEALKTAKAAMAQVRQRLAESRKGWAPLAPSERERLRAELAKKAKVGTPELAKLTAAQGKRLYPQLKQP